MVTLAPAEGARCERCFKTLTDGVHGIGSCPLEPRSRQVSIITDDIPGGVTYENYGPTPVTFYSHTERRAFMAAHGLTQKEKFCPTPGTDIDPAGIPNPKGYIDPQTLENAAVLVTRVAPRSPLALGPELIVHTFNIVGEKDAMAFTEEGHDPRRQNRIGRRLHDNAMDTRREHSDSGEGRGADPRGGAEATGASPRVRGEARADRAVREVRPLAGGEE